MVGVEGNIYYQNAETSFVQSGRPPWFSSTGRETVTGSIKQGTNGSFRLRAGALVTPFPKAPLVNGPVHVEPLRPQHAHFVATIKTNRAFQNLDRISSNGGKLTYECVWAQADGGGPWLCMFALDL